MQFTVDQTYFDVHFTCRIKTFLIKALNEHPSKVTYEKGALSLCY